MRRAWTVSAVLLLAACQGEHAAGDAAVELNLEADAPAAAGEAASRATPAPQATEGAEAAGPEATTPLLAYAYAYTLELPAAQVSPVMATHQRACVEAGPAVCQVVGASVSRPSEDRVFARLQLRARPDWLDRFRQGLGGDAEAAGGDISDSRIETEDLSRAIIDTEAHLSAKTTLRDRLQAILASRPGDLQQVLEVERELARVQGEIDAARSNLEAMRTRVRTSRLTLDYRSQGVLAPDDAVWPLKSALENALSVFFGAVGALVLFAAGALPFVLVIAPLVWWWLRRRRAEADRRRAARAEALARTEGDAPG